MDVTRKAELARRLCMMRDMGTNVISAIASAVDDGEFTTTEGLELLDAVRTLDAAQ